MPRTAFTLLSTLFAATTLVADQKFGCKCTASDACWPSKSEWDTFSATLTHPVFHVVPPGYYCHDPYYNAELCGEAQKSYLDQNWIGDQPGGSMADNWAFNATSWCFIHDDRTKPCGQGRVPSVGVNATSDKDVQAAMAFAIKHDLKVHVKNSGHDFLGRGLGPGSFLIWTHYWKGATFHPDFKYHSGESAHVPAMTVLPGTQWFEAYKAADDNEVTIAGAIVINGTVGAGGGYAMGAGHNIMSPHLGLAADNLLEISVVLPNATQVIANTYQNTELFWAIRGGGGPSFGIATSMAFKVYPQFPVYAVFFEATAKSSEVYIDLLDSFFSTMPELAKAGWSGFFPFAGPSNYLALLYLLPHGDTSTGNATLGAWIEKAAKIPGVTVKTDASRSYPNFGAWVDANIVHPRDVIGFHYASTGLGNGNAAGSWLLPDTVFGDTAKIHQLSQAMSKLPAGLGQHVGGGLVAERERDFNAVHPAWRDALVNLVVFSGWKDGASQSQIQAVFKGLSDAMASVRALTPQNPAQYLNEPDLLVPGFTQANWGSNYPRLAAIKKKIDPDNMLLVIQGVGSENWDSEQICPK